MGKKDILRNLDTIDIFMKQYLNENYKFRNSEDPYVDMHYKLLKQIAQKNELKYISTKIVERIEMTKKAFEDARDQNRAVKEWDMSYPYYEYINSKSTIIEMI